MNTTDLRLEPSEDLYRRARAIVDDREDRLHAPLDVLSPEATQQMVHELWIHQVELEMQNEELRRAQQALDVARARYFTLYDQAPVGYCTLSENGLIREANFCAATLLGVTRDALDGQPILNFIQSEDRDIFYLHSKQLMAGGEALACEVRMLRPGGTPLWVRCQSTTAREPDGILVLRVVLSNIGERKRIETELLAAKQAAETANLAKSRFLAAASHDLRQPIQAICLFNDALLRTPLSAEQSRISDYLSLSVHSLGELLGALLDISKLDAGIVRPFPEVVEVESFFSRLADELSPMASEKCLRFMLFYPRREMAIIADRKLLMSLLGNLIGNAIKYTAQGGVLVGIRCRAGQAVIQVWDSGIGIAPEHRKHIFEEYFQIQNRERDGAKGLGLGLAIVKRLAALMGTEVLCRSRLGRGSVFEFCLPLAEYAPPLAACPPAPSGREGVGRRVVVVEDDVMVARAIALSLESIGMTVSTYPSAEEALADSEILEAQAYISDFQLPGLNGAQFLSTLRQRSTMPFKAVILTGDTSAERIEAIRSSPWPLLFKPVELAKLLAAIGV